ncbi:peptidoglycan-recognition protein SC2-like [Asterias amurensis]|uniref:peptidoglycan-recognition protein SC2-like n=1 Tax=Asterias amurensis TaxID=7602 RepID=UPI003AB22936
MLKMDVIRLIVFVCCMMLLQTGRANSSGCSDVNFVERSSWGASSPRSTTSLAGNLDYYIIHHTDGGSCYSQSACSRRVRGIQNYHKNTKGWDDIGYNFLIGSDNKVYVGRGWNNQGAHTTSFNSRSIGIAMIGNYVSGQPSSGMMNALNNLRQCGVDLGKVKRDYHACGHSSFSRTACPGSALSRLVNGWGRCDR